MKMVRKPANILARVILGIITLWAFSTTFLMATHPPF